MQLWGDVVLRLSKKIESEHHPQRLILVEMQEHLNNKKARSYTKKEMPSLRDCTESSGG